MKEQWKGNNAKASAYFLSSSVLSCNNRIRKTGTQRYKLSVAGATYIVDREEGGGGGADGGQTLSEITLLIRPLIAMA